MTVDGSRAEGLTEVANRPSRPSPEESLALYELRAFSLVAAALRAGTRETYVRPPDILEAEVTQEARQR